MRSDAYEQRFAHTHVLGGSGHGKTQLLQTLIYRDLTSNRTNPPSIVIIDSQGDLIRTISQLALFDPYGYENLAGRFLFIDPADIEYPPAINLFDANQNRIATYGAVERERIFNGTIELYEYFFSALLGADLTQKQNLIFRYLAQLMLSIDGANIHTLRELLETSEAFQADIARLDGTARLFFEKQFFDKSFDDTRTQVSRRLWGVLANRSFERIFSSRTSKIDLFDAMNDGKVILINTSKDLLKQEGAAVFGRFFISLIAQAALERAQIPRDKRRATFVYIDEAQDYFDENIDGMLEQVRKYKIGLTLAHQTLAQLTPKLKASIMANTGTKLVGGLSANDAATMAKEMGCDPKFLLSMRKDRETTSFALSVRSQATRPREVKIKLGVVDQMEQMDRESYDRLIDINRERYCLPIDLVEQKATPSVVETEVNETPSPPVIVEPTEPSEPTITHTDLLQQIKGWANERDFFAQTEAPVFGGAGRVDVLLEREDLKIAVEVSLGNKIPDEMANVRKCVNAGYQHIWLVSTSAKRNEALTAAVDVGFTGEDRDRVRVWLIDDVAGLLDSFARVEPPNELMVRGYRVSVVTKPLEPESRKRKRDQLDRLLAATKNKTRRSQEVTSPV